MLQDQRWQTGGWGAQSWAKSGPFQEICAVDPTTLFLESGATENQTQRQQLTRTTYCLQERLNKWSTNPQA